MKAAIIATSITITAIVIILIAWSQISDNRTHNQFCANWSINLDERRAQLEEQWFPDYDQFNADVADFNKQCAF